MNQTGNPTDPKVSVLMATFNCESTIREAVASIAAQTYSNWELVVCDDGSTDSTPAILNELMAELGPGRCILLRNDTNRRLAYSLNRCLEVATGDLIARMDGDDISQPERLTVQVRFLQAHPEFDVVGTSMRRFNAQGPGDVVQAIEAPDRWTMARTTNSPFFHATILARRAMFDRVGNYTVAWRTQRGQDLDLWFKFFAAGLSGRNLPEPLYWVREDGAAIRRRTPKARIGSYLTRLKGNWALGYPPSAYVRCTVDVLKILLPYRLFDWHRKRLRERAATVERQEARTR